MQPIKNPGICRVGTTFSILLVGLAYSYALFLAPSCWGQETKAEVPKEKQTTLGLYVTAAQAYEKWKAAPDSVKVIDVRTPEEYIFVGHAEMAMNIPVALVTYRWEVNEKGEPTCAMNPNLRFVEQVNAWAKPSDTLLVMCRSGGRGAKAVNLLAEAGFKKVFNIIDGMEGDTVKDPESLFDGKRMKNGWKNSGLPWTYKVNPKQMRLPTDE